MANSQGLPNRTQFRYLDLVMAFFVAVLLVSNVASSAKIVDLGFSLFTVRLAFDGGTLLFPLSYIIGDIMTEVYGFQAARRVIWTGFAAMALASILFFILRLLPGEAGWESKAGSAAYDTILGGMSSGGLALAGLLGYWSGSFANAIVLAKMKLATAGRALWLRTIGSTLVGEFIDTLVFVAVASATGVFAWELFVSLVLANYLFKCGIEIVMTPATYVLVNRLKKTEGVDVYDEDITFNPFGRWKG